MPTYVRDTSIPRPGFLGSGEWGLSGLTGITVLFGKNGSGKSLLLRAFRDANRDRSHYVVPERTGDLQFEPSFIHSQMTPQQRMEHSRLNFAQEYRKQILARIQLYFISRGASRTESTPLPVPPMELERMLSHLLPDLTIELTGEAPPFKITRAHDSSVVDRIEQLSSGEAQILSIGLDILTISAIWNIKNQPDRIILIDEPDAHIHPDLQARFADFVVQVGRRFELQIVVATHSTTLLAALGQFGNEETSIIYIDRQRLNFSATPFTSVLKEVAACLGGNALMGPLFGLPLLLVEGDDDYRIWSQVPRHHKVSFATIPSRGQEIFEYQKTLERIFASIRSENPSPSGYAIIDGDKGKPQASDTNPQDYVKFLQLSCYESENLFFTDEVLQLLGTDWNEAQRQIVQESGNFGNKAEKLANAAAWDRMKDDLKDVVNEVSRILDKKNVHWTVRVGHAIGRSKPAGQLGEFLGSEVVSAIWLD